MENNHKPHITRKKERTVDELVRLMKEYPIIGIVDMTNLPALQFQRIKSKLSDKLEFRMVKKRLIKIAFDKVKDKKNIEKLKDRLEGIPALIFTKQDPFKLAKAIKKEVSPASAKAGQVAPDDIVLSAGPTPFMAGPMIGELGAMGIKSKVEAGKINVVEDKILVKKGEEINDKIADLLSKLGIEPMQVGFNLLLTYKDGEILEKDVLFVDEKLYLETLQQFAREANGLAIYIGYISKDTVGELLRKAYNEAKAVSDVAKLEEKMEVKEEKKEEPVEVPKEETKEEEIKEAPKVEEPIKEEKKEEKIEEKPEEEPKEEPEEEKPVEEPMEEKKEEPIEEEPKEEPEVEKKPEEEPMEEKKEPQQEKVEEEKTPKAPEKEEKKEPEKEQVEEKKEEPKEEEKQEEEQLKDVKEKDMKLGMKTAKDITKEDMDRAKRQLQELQDKIIKGGKK